MKILIVDDDRDTVTTLKDRLDFEGHETFVAYEGLRGVEMTHRKRPDVILLDYKMPAGNGLSVLYNLKARVDTKDIPVIILTGMQGESLEIELKAAGAQDFIHKPYDMELLLDKIRTLVPRERGPKQAPT